MLNVRSEGGGTERCINSVANLVSKLWTRIGFPALVLSVEVNFKLPIDYALVLCHDVTMLHSSPLNCTLSLRRSGRSSAFLEF